jgi:sortase (surface protein transpeptidase)
LITGAVLVLAGCSGRSPTASKPVPGKSATTALPAAPDLGGRHSTNPRTGSAPAKVNAPLAPPMGRSVPVRVRIPSIGVDSSLIPLGLQSDNTLQVPPNGFPAGWFTGAPTPGQTGPAVIAGHVHWAGSPGVFYSLEKVSPGDRVTVLRRNGSVAVFTVTHVALYPKSTFPTSAVYGNIDFPGLRLITCGGLNAQTGIYDDNTVVFARLVGERNRADAAG